jgi:hypothetical protein
MVVLCREFRIERRGFVAVVGKGEGREGDRNEIEWVAGWGASADTDGQMMTR